MQLPLLVPREVYEGDKVMKKVNSTKLNFIFSIFIRECQTLDPPGDFSIPRGVSRDDRVAKKIKLLNN